MSSKSTKSLEKFHTKTFENTTEDRRTAVLKVAISEFAKNGYQATNVNVIAQKAGISVGALYRYFATKEDLFLSIVTQQKTVLSQIIGEMDEQVGIAKQIRQMFELSRSYGLKFRELSQIYLDITTESLSELASRLTEDMEKAIAEHLINILNHAKERGEISSEADIPVTAFCIDNLMTMYQLSHSSSYFARRLAMYIGQERMDDTADLIDPIMTFIIGQL